MKITLYKVQFGGCWDSNINDNVRNILKFNGFVLNNQDEEINHNHSYNGYPSGFDYSTWYKDNQYKNFTYQQHPRWVPEGDSEGLLILNSEQYAELMFANEQLEDKFKFDRVSKSIIEVDHPLESIMKELGTVLSSGFGDVVMKQLMKKGIK